MPVTLQAWLLQCGLAVLLAGMRDGPTEWARRLLLRALAPVWKDAGKLLRCTICMSFWTGAVSALVYGLDAGAAACVVAAGPFTFWTIERLRTSHVVYKVESKSGDSASNEIATDDETGAPNSGSADCGCAETTGRNDR